MVASVKRFAFAPAAAADDRPTRFRDGRLRIRLSVRSFRDDISAVGNQLAVHAKNGLQRTFNLRGSVVFGLQTAHGSLDQLPQNRYIFRRREPQTNLRCRFHPHLWNTPPNFTASPSRAVRFSFFVLTIRNIVAVADAS